MKKMRQNKIWGNKSKDCMGKIMWPSFCGENSLIGNSCKNRNCRILKKLSGLVQKLVHYFLNVSLFYTEK